MSPVDELDWNDLNSNLRALLVPGGMIVETIDNIGGDIATSTGILVPCDEIAARKWIAARLFVEKEEKK